MSGQSKILITGGTGYLGRYLIDSLCKRENLLISCFIRPNSDTSLLPKNISFIKKFDELQEYDYVFHLATCYGRNGESIEEIKHTNFNFPIELTKLLNKNSYFFNFSTSLPEKLNVYSKTKNEFSEFMKNEKAFKKFLNLKIENFYGPGDSYFVGKVFNDLTLNKKNIPLTLGTHKRDFIFIDDLVNAIILIFDKIDKIETGYSDISIGSGESITIKDLVLKMKEITKSSSKLDFGAIELRKNEPEDLKSDNKVLKKLGWSPKVGLIEGLKRLTN